MGGQANYEKLILKYSFGCNKSLMDIYLNTNQDEIHLPHEFLEAYKQQILEEINPLLKKNFGNCAKIYFYFSLNMQKLSENDTTEFSPTQIKSSPEEINPQDEGLTEAKMGCIIADLDFKYDTAPCEGSGW